jgi:hypothetical protein
MPALHPYISEEFNSPIWRFEIDAVTETMGIEIRDETEKQVSFSTLGLKKGQIQFNGFTTDERWFTGIEAIYNGVLLLHNYQSANGPAHKGIIAVDAMSTEILWSNYNYSFERLTANGPVFYDSRFQPKKLFVADIKTGAPIRPFGPSVDAELENHIEMPQIISPEFLPADLLPPAFYGNSIHYLQYNNFRIVSLHALQAGQLQQYLYVFDGVDKVYEDLLNTAIQKLQPEAFIIYKNHLIYIKNKSALIVLAL